MSQLHPNNTVDLTLTVEETRQLADMVESGTPLACKLAAMVEYLRLREAGEWDFITMGAPFRERNHVNGNNIGASIEAAAGWDTRSTTITRRIPDSGGQVEYLGYIKRPTGGYSDVWHVMQYGTDKFLGEINCVGPSEWEVINKGYPNVTRASMHHAILTCYMRGTTPRKTKLKKKVPLKKEKT